MKGAHIATALCMGVFKEVKFLGLGMQVDVAAAQMTNFQMGIFCLAGVLGTWITAVLLTVFTPRICWIKSKVLRAVFYYITIVMLLLDPLYLSVLCGFFGGGDMNGISLLMPEMAARVIFGILLYLHGGVFAKHVLPAYQAKKRKTEEEYEDSYMTEGMCIGMAVGVAVNAQYGMCIGMLIGMVIGMLVKKESKDK